jgi:hypothetical protein
LTEGCLHSTSTQHYCTLRGKKIEKSAPKIKASDSKTTEELGKKSSTLTEQKQHSSLAPFSAHPGG